VGHRIAPEVSVEVAESLRPWCKRVWWWVVEPRSPWLRCEVWWVFRSLWSRCKKVWCVVVMVEVSVGVVSRRSKGMRREGGRWVVVMERPANPNGY
jgi:hypothetical protein